MLTIRSFPQGARVARVDYPYKVVLPNGVLATTFALGIGYFNPSNQQPLEGQISLTIDGLISDSNSKILIDKPCTHHQVSGDLINVPSLRVVDDVSDLFPRTLFGGESFSKILSSDGIWVETVAVPDVVHDPVIRGDYKNVTMKRLHYKHGDSFGFGIYYTRTQCARVRWGVPTWQYTEECLIEPFKFSNASHCTIVGGNIIPWTESMDELLTLLGSVSYISWSSTTPWCSTTGSLIPLTNAEVKYWSDRQYLRPSYSLDTDTDKMYGNLAQNCIDQQSYTDVQSLAFLRELSEIKMLVPRLGSLRKPKTYADLFLWYKYGATLTIKDSKSLFRDINSAVNTAKMVRLRPFYSSKTVTGKVGEVFVQEDYHYKVVSEPYPSEVMDIVRSLWSWKLYPNLETGWEMIPFSFVIDWIIDVSSMLHRLDQELIKQYYKVLAVTWSKKVEYSLPANRIVTNTPLVGDVKFTYYERDVGKQLHYIPFPDLKIQEFHNIMELTALVVQRVR